MPKPIVHHIPVCPFCQRLGDFLGAGNGALLPGRSRSSFTFDPDWRTRPWPPRNKYEHCATDAELGL